MSTKRIMIEPTREEAEIGLVPYIPIADKPPPIPPTRLTVAIPENMRARMDDYCYVAGLSRSSLVRLALAQFFRDAES